jgi:hypothetical protein
MRLLALACGFGLAAPALAQAVVTSPAPDRVAVTVYRNPDRGLEPFNPNWLGGYALVSEIRHVRLPAGASEFRFEGVTSGIIPQSAIVTGLGEAVLEKNRDARLLSPGALLDASLGERLSLRRTDRATGRVTEQEAIVRASTEGIVIQTAAGVEALRCTGLPETLLAQRVPPGLSAKPTLSVRIRSPEAVERDVVLSYLTNNFDWQANYVAELSAAGDRVSLFAWLTLASTDQTGLADAETQAVAGKLNRDRVWPNQGDWKSIRISCWPQATTSDIADERQGYDIVVTGTRIPVAGLPPAPPPPPPAAERSDDDAGYAMKASQEQLGDVKLYRIPERVTVSTQSQKQVAMITQPAVKIATILRLRPQFGDFQAPLERVLITHNKKAEGLGLPLPAGRVALFGRIKGRRILIGEGRLDDHAIGEKVEIPIATATGVVATQTSYRRDKSENYAPGYDLVLTNDMAYPQQVEVELPLNSVPVSRKLVKRDGWLLWQTTIPANGKAKLRWHG